MHTDIHYYEIYSKSNELINDGKGNDCCESINHSFEKTGYVMFYIRKDFLKNNNKTIKELKKFIKILKGAGFPMKIVDLNSNCTTVGDSIEIKLEYKNYTCGAHALAGIQILRFIYNTTFYATAYEDLFMLKKKNPKLSWVECIAYLGYVKQEHFYGANSPAGNNCLFLPINKKQFKERLKIAKTLPNYSKIYPLFRFDSFTVSLFTTDILPIIVSTFKEYEYNIPKMRKYLKKLLKNPLKEVCNILNIEIEEVENNIVIGEKYGDAGKVIKVAGIYREAGIYKTRYLVKRELKYGGTYNFKYKLKSSIIMTRNDLIYYRNQKKLDKNFSQLFFGT